MKATPIIAIILASLSLAVSSCYYDNVESLYPEGSNCAPDTVDFLLTIKPMINEKCATAGCHVSGTGRKDLSTDQGILDIAKDGRLEDRAIIQRDMPPVQALSSCETAYLRTWLDNGAPIK